MVFCFAVRVCGNEARKLHSACNLFAALNAICRASAAFAVIALGDIPYGSPKQKPSLGAPAIEQVHRGACLQSETV